MKLMSDKDIQEHEEKICTALLEVLEVKDDFILRVLKLLKEKYLQCWLLLDKNSICTGYAITGEVDDNFSGEKLFTIYLLKTIETFTIAELRSFFVSLCLEAKQRNCKALSFYSSFQNESKYNVVKTLGGTAKTYFYVEV
jgi:hypothetical protein